MAFKVQILKCNGEKKSPVQDKQAEIFFMPYFSSFHEDAVTIEITLMTVVEFHIVADEIHRF